MKIDFLTLFPDMFEGVLGSSILQKHRRKTPLNLMSSISAPFLITSIKQWMTILTAEGRAWF